MLALLARSLRLKSEALNMRIEQYQCAEFGYNYLGAAQEEKVSNLDTHKNKTHTANMLLIKSILLAFLTNNIMCLENIHW